MAIQLSKGQRIDLTKTNPGLTKAVIGLGWDTNKYSGGHDFDLDASTASLLSALRICLNRLANRSLLQCGQGRLGSLSRLRRISTRRYVCKAPLQ